MPRFTIFGCLALSAMAAFSALPTMAQEFPTKPIRLIVPFSPGGGTDVTARIIAPAASELLGQPVVVENRPGAGGSVGAEMASRAEADGHTLLVYANTATIDPSFREDLPYNFQDDFAPITIGSVGPYVLIAHPELPADTVEELISYAEENPGRVNFASPGVGTVAHLGMELFKYQAGIDIVHIPYNGSGASTAGVASNEAQISLEVPLQTMARVEEGQIKALGITSTERSPLLPNVPTIAESGYPDYELITWIGIFAPEGTPSDVVAKLHDAFASSINSPELSEEFVARGMEGGGNTPEDFAARIDREIPMWAQLIEDANIPKP